MFRIQTFYNLFSKKKSRRQQLTPLTHQIYYPTFLKKAKILIYIKVSQMFTLQKGLL